LLTHERHDGDDRQRVRPGAVHLGCRRAGFEPAAGFVTEDHPAALRSRRTAHPAAAAAERILDVLRDGVGAP
jgi:hypothetical protein